MWLHACDINHNTAELQSRSLPDRCDDDHDELQADLQEGRWNILWMSGRFRTMVRMQEDMPHGHLTSSSLKSTIFNEHEGEWQVRVPQHPP